MKTKTIHERIDAMPLEELARDLYAERLNRYHLYDSTALELDWRLRADQAGMFIPLMRSAKARLVNQQIDCLEDKGLFAPEPHFQHHRYADTHVPIRSSREAVIRWSLQLVLQQPKNDEPYILEVDLDGWNAHYKQGIGITAAHGFHAARHKIGTLFGVTNCEVLGMRPFARTNLRKAAHWLVDHRNVTL